MAPTQLTKKITYLLGAFTLFNLAGCATGKTPGDPYESLNRKTFAFNMAMDKAVLRPVAKTYNFITPNYVQARVTNFFENTGLIPATVNDILQLNLYQTLADSSRFIINTTIGIGGLYDVASHGNLPDHHNDFGLTMARWGLPDSPYLVIPILGPSTIRDTFGLPVDVYTTIWPYINPIWIGWTAFGVDKINIRAALLPSDKLVDEAFDPYVFVRDAYMQHRQNQVNEILNKKPMNEETTTGTPETGDTFVAGEAGVVRINGTTPDNDTFVPAAGPGSTAATTSQPITPAAETTTPKKKTKKHPMVNLPAPMQLTH